jgi:hypothetical protein
MPQDRSQQSGRTRQPAFDRSESVRDQQQIADENQQSGVVDTEEISNRSAEIDPSEIDFEEEEDDRA